MIKNISNSPQLMKTILINEIHRKISKGIEKNFINYDNDEILPDII